MLRQKAGLDRIRLEGAHMEVLVCDDNYETVEKISNIVEMYCQEKGKTLMITKNTNPEEVDIAKRFDIAFLDIDMPQMSGIELARRVHSLQPDTIIIFITNYIQYAPEGYEVGAFRYLMKDQISKKLNYYLDFAIEEMVKRRRVTTIQVNGECIDIPVANILYTESQRRIIVMHLINDQRAEYRFYGNITDLEQRFEIFGFLRVHKSYLVNMRYIEIFQCKRLVLKGGIQIPSSTRRYSDLKQQYLKWEAENKWSIC